ncbi:MAG: type II toxin-antitoxin system Phd/YefM family antitoxin [bacterium]|nr:type II toxin-antitoxin system Phd/YefM family antitoxin [bacterium]
MPIIRPVSDLRNNFNEISELCHAGNEPVFITRQGKGDMVVMSHTHYENISALLELYGQLSESEAKKPLHKR